MFGGRRWGGWRGLASGPVVDTPRVNSAAKIRTWGALVTVAAVIAGSALAGAPAGAAPRHFRSGWPTSVTAGRSSSSPPQTGRRATPDSKLGNSGLTVTWTRVMRGVPARLGWSGFAKEKNRLQNTGKTPAGTFALPRGFGLDKPKGADLRYRRIDNNDWWPYDPQDPKTYNVMQFRRPPACSLAYRLGRTPA